MAPIDSPDPREDTPWSSRPVSTPLPHSATTKRLGRWWWPMRHRTGSRCSPSPTRTPRFSGRSSPATQGALCAQAGDAGRFDPAGESEDVLTALFTERDRPFAGIDRPSGGRSYDWQHDVPLVLLDTDYEPYTGRRTPTGPIVWLRPALESSYLDSLAEIGAVRQLVKVG